MQRRRLNSQKTEECLQYLQILNPWMLEEPGREQDRKAGIDKDKVTNTGFLKIPCTVIKSSRKSLSMQLKEDKGLILRIPNGMKTSEALSFAGRHEQWISRQLKRLSEENKIKKQYSEAEIQAYKKKLRPVLEHRAAYYAQLLNVTYGRISIRDQKTRWGSCSAKGYLNFNWKLVLMPPEILDYVVVHELAHRLEMNHSPRFWAGVERILPDYQARRAWLKENGRYQ